MPTIDIIFLTLAVSNLLVLGVYVLLYHRHTSIGILAFFLILTLVSGLLGEGFNSIVSSENSTLLIFTRMALNRIGNVSMILIWLLSLKLFDDNFEVRTMHPGIWGLIVVALILRSIASYFANYAIELSSIAYLATWGFSQTVLLGFSLAVIYVAIKGFRVDLVIERRHERVIFVVCAALLLLMMAGNRGVWVYSAITEGAFRPVPMPQIVYSVYAYFVTVALLLWKFRAVQFSAIKSPAKQLPDTANEEQHERERKLSDRIKVAMEEESLFQESSLTVRALAEHLTSQEYLVRRAINNHMGYRNFSEFLNKYRISKAQHLLTDSDEPITNIGFNVGYTSLSSFFTAFKSVHGLTPKQYREQQV